MGYRGRPHTVSCVVLRRTSRDDAACRRSICLPARSLFSALGVFVRLDSVSCHSNGDDRRFISWVLPLSWRAVATNLRDELHHPAHPYSADLCALAIDRSTGRALGHKFSDMDQYEGPQVFSLAGHGLSPATALGMLVALCSAQIGALYAADAWNNITFTAGEVRNPTRNVPLSLAFGTIIVIGLYVFANFAYVVVLPFSEIQHAPSDRVAATMLQAIFPSLGPTLIAVAIMIAAFGCMNALILSGARAYYAMSLDGLFFKRASVLNQANVPGAAL